MKKRAREFGNRSSDDMRTTGQSHKNRFTVLYEIINRGVALADGTEETCGRMKSPEPRRGIGFGCCDELETKGAGRGFCNFVYILHAAGECTFEAISRRILNI